MCVPFEQLIPLPCLIQGGLVAGHVALQRSDLFTGLILSGPAVEQAAGWLTVSNGFM